ncbi:hypothetical protein [Paraflavitalea speifideaquila]|uniref:helix-turn-helix transcriptional regulator n=1 Tax=Paraflavitalea speifideaquila TaxID=3076558 RepID=UPI0028E47311|nr:hypothetical protein [Paraflavitalea speifideiaquila]
MGDIINGKRRISPRIALKLDHQLGKEEGYFMVLQAFYDVALELQRMAEEEQQDKPRLRPVLFGIRI